MTYLIRPDWMLEYLDQIRDLPLNEQVDAVRLYVELHAAPRDLTADYDERTFVSLAGDYAA